MCSRFLPRNKHQSITLDRHPWPAYESTPQFYTTYFRAEPQTPLEKNSNFSRRASTDTSLRGVEDAQAIPGSKFLYTTTPAPSTSIILESIYSSYWGSSIIELSIPGKFV